MLRSFRVANHKSIRDEQELLLLPAYDSDHPVLAVAAVYGANASGKSNVLDALRFMRSAVVDSYARWEPDQGVPRQPFRMSVEARNMPSHFVVDVDLDDVRYTYGFSVDDDRVLEEWLYSYPEKRRRIIFERKRDEIKFGTTVSPQRGRAEILEELTRPNALFLSVASRTNLAALLPMYEWFLRSVVFFSPALYGGLSQDLTKLFSEGELRRKMVLELLRFADLGIVDVKVEKVPTSSLSRDRLVFLHSASNSPFYLNDESAGTRTWLYILDQLLPVLENGLVWVMDEIDTSLHPRLTARLIALFQDPATNSRGAQLVCTTHDTTLLSPTLGEEVLRRDQVWFTEKDDSGATSLYPLSDFKPRKGENTERRYLGGSYGAVPRLLPEDFARTARNAESGAQSEA